MTTHKHFFLAATAGSFFIANTCFAGPFSIEPVGTLPTSIAAGDTVSATYTITNLTNVNTTSNQVKYLPPNVAVNTSTTTCSPSSSGFSLAAYASCTLGLSVSGAVNSSDANPQHHLFVCMSDGISCAGPTPANSLNVSVGGAVPIVLTVAGQDYIGDFPPILAQSTDGGQTWAVKPISGLPISGYYNSTSCTGSGSSTVCIAAGYDDATNTTPLLVATSNGGATWALKSISGLTSVDVGFDSTSCTGSGSTAICVAAGQEYEGTNPALLALSTDGGVSWSKVTTTTPALPANSYFTGVGCTGSGSNAICTAAGRVSTDNSPLLEVSTNGGTSWTRITTTTPALPATGTLYAASCTGSGSSAICMATGQDSGTNAPLLVVTTNGGTSWTRITSTTPALPANGRLNYNASCTGSGANAVCVAVGRDNTNTAPLVVVGTNGGTIWTRIPNDAVSLPTSGNAYGSSCTGSGSTAICTVTGDTSPGLFLSASTDGGVTWNLQTVTGLTTTNGYFWPTACTGSGSSAVCTAGGYDNDTSSGFLAISYDGAATWALVDVDGVTANYEWWAAGTSHSGSSLKKKIHHQKFGAKKVLEGMFQKA